MDRFVSGLVAGGIVGGIGLSYFLKDRKNRKHLMKDTKKAINKGKAIFEELQDMM